MIRQSSEPALSEPLSLAADAAPDGFTTLALRVARWARSLPSLQHGGLAPGDAGPQAAIVGVTSCTAGRAATATAGQLALAAAAVFPRGVLVVDASVAHDRLAPEHVEHSGHSNVWLLRSSGARHATPSRLPFEAEEFWARLQPLRASYGLVLVDLPPAGQSEQALALAARLDGVLLVVEAERTHGRVAQRVKEDLETLGARLLGAVLTGAREQLPAWLDRRLP
jgi:non-specific protein-tyrosine kinase